MSDPHRSLVKAEITSRMRRELTRLNRAVRKADTRQAFYRELRAPFAETIDPELAFMNTGRIVRIGGWIVLGFVLVVFGWGALAPLDSAIMAPGVITVSSHVKTVQHLEGGIVRDILVNDGQSVKAGQVLMHLDPTQAKSNLATLQDQDDALRAQEARLVAERDGTDTIQFPPELTSRGSNPSVAAAMQGEENVFKSQHDTLAQQVDIMNKRSGENGTVISGLRAEKEAVAKQLEYTDQETKSIKTLYAQGLATLPRLLALEKQHADLAGQQSQLSEKIAQTEMTSGENDIQIMNLKSQRQDDVVKELRDVQTKLSDTDDRLRAARDILARTTVRAPEAGKVLNLSVHTDGAVVQPGEALLQVVPQKDTLVVEARVRPEDADNVHIGMKARVDFSGYETRRLPIIDGQVTYISADRQVDPRSGEAFFTANVSVDPGVLKNYPDAKLIPGLPVDVAFNTGSRTALEYLTEPITDVFRKGMREK